MWKPNNQTSPILPHNASNGRYTPSKSSGSLWVYHMLPCYPHFALIVSVLGFLTFSTKPLLLCFRFLLFFFSSSLPGTTCRGSEWRSGVVAGIWEPQTVPIFTRYMHAKSCHVCVCMICFFTHNKSQMTLPYGILARRTQNACSGTRVPNAGGVYGGVWLQKPPNPFFCSLQLKFFNFFKSSWTSVNSTTIKFVRGQNLFFFREKKDPGRKPSLPHKPGEARTFFASAKRIRSWEDQLSGGFIHHFEPIRALEILS